MTSRFLRKRSNPESSQLRLKDVMSPPSKKNHNGHQQMLEKERQKKVDAAASPRRTSPRRSDRVRHEEEGVDPGEQNEGAPEPPAVFGEDAGDNDDDDLVADSEYVSETTESEAPQPRPAPESHQKPTSVDSLDGEDQDDRALAAVKMMFETINNNIDAHVQQSKTIEEAVKRVAKLESVAVATSVIKEETRKCLEGVTVCRREVRALKNEVRKMAISQHASVERRRSRSRSTASSSAVLTKKRKRRSSPVKHKSSEFRGTGVCRCGSGHYNFYKGWCDLDRHRVGGATKCPYWFPNKEIPVGHHPGYDIAGYEWHSDHPDHQTWFNEEEMKKKVNEQRRKMKERADHGISSASDDDVFSISDDESSVASDDSGPSHGRRRRAYRH